MSSPPQSASEDHPQDDKGIEQDAPKSVFSRTAPDFKKKSLDLKRRSLDLFSRLSQISTGASHGPAGESQEQEKCRKFVGAQTDWATKLLDKVTTEGGVNRMPESILNGCEGLAFINCTKGGLVVSAARGYGFVIKKLTQERNGNSTWSTPLFFTISQLGVGLTAGYQHTQSVLALVSESAVDAFKQPTTVMGTDLLLVSTDGALTGMTAGTLGHTSQMGLTGVQHKSSFCYSIVDGVYMEISMHGTTIKPDHNTNYGLYKDQHTPDEVLGGKTHMLLPELGNLYRTINTHGRKALGN